MDGKTFELFTVNYSVKIPAENMAVAVFRFMETMEDANDMKNVIAIIETDRGKEFIKNQDQASHKKEKLKELYELREHHFKILNDWKGNEALTRAGMAADLAIIESKIELLEKYVTYS